LTPRTKLILKNFGLLYDVHLLWKQRKEVVCRPVDFGGGLLCSSI
jgi:hypothetical protein